MIYGYARVSTKGQARDGNSLDAQERLLRDSGAEVIYTEAFTGTKRHRPELDRLLGVLEEGDTVVVSKLDRIARSTKDGIAIMEEITGKGCTLNILNMGKFDNTPTGKLLRTILLAFAEFERDMIVMRTSEGKEIARQREGWREGARPKDIPSFEEYRERQRRGEITIAKACGEMGISVSTWHRRCAK